MSSLEVYAQGDRGRLRQLHALANAPNLIPDSFKVNGQVQWGDVALAARQAALLDLDPVANLKLFPVVKGQVWPMSEVWQLLARRHGWRVTCQVDTAERCVVRMVNTRTGETPPDFEMTLDEARQLGAAKTNPNYRDGGARSMVRARAIRTAIKVNAPEVMNDPVITGWGDEEVSGPPVLAEQDEVHDGEIMGGLSTGGSEPTQPPRTAASYAARSRLADAIDGLPDPVRDDLRRACIDVELPNLQTSPLFNLADAALLERLIGEALQRAEIYAYQDAIDDQPEAATHDDDSNTYRYDPDENVEIEPPF